MSAEKFRNSSEDEYSAESADPDSEPSIQTAAATIFFTVRNPREKKDAETESQIEDRAGMTAACGL